MEVKIALETEPDTPLLIFHYTGSIIIDTLATVPIGTSSRRQTCAFPKTV